MQSVKWIIPVAQVIAFVLGSFPQLLKEPRPELRRRVAGFDYRQVIPFLAGNGRGMRTFDHAGLHRVPGQYCTDQCNPVAMRCQLQCHAVGVSKQRRLSMAPHLVGPRPPTTRGTHGFDQRQRVERARKIR